MGGMLHMLRGDGRCVGGVVSVNFSINNFSQCKIKMFGSDLDLAKPRAAKVLPHLRQHTALLIEINDESRMKSEA
ncbi:MULTISPECIES: hypothetical protein [unclassified Bradyrhizobium]|jgi:hypothetical protein|uniref:hypothetical protein n=1 Tax=unclassified Bradyrhizobium TaxID=2631580 RepID=UPI0005A2D48D|nr:hypothetical protein [Bradyrhizobium sp. BTAi1]